MDVEDLENRISEYCDINPQAYFIVITASSDCDLASFSSVKTTGEGKPSGCLSNSTNRTDSKDSSMILRCRNERKIVRKVVLCMAIFLVAGKFVELVSGMDQGRIW